MLCLYEKAGAAILSLHLATDASKESCVQKLHCYRLW